MKAIIYSWLRSSCELLEAYPKQTKRCLCVLLADVLICLDDCGAIDRYSMKEIGNIFAKIVG